MQNNSNKTTDFLANFRIPNLEHYYLPFFKSFKRFYLDHGDIVYDLTLRLFKISNQFNVALVIRAQ